MLFYRVVDGKILREAWVAGAGVPSDTVWIDLLAPTKEEEALVESAFSINIPTREEMREIELSRRLYQEDGAQFMTATMLSKVDTGVPETHAATFVLKDNCLITIRYIETTSFRRFAAQLLKSPTPVDAAWLMLALLDTIVNRLADILERLDHDIDAVTKDVFRAPTVKGKRVEVDYRLVLERIGRCGDLASKAHESLVTLGRVAGFASHNKYLAQEANEVELISIRKDITGLTDHGNYLTGKVNFLLDATLGMISIQQNTVFRVLSVASLILMPPTLLAGIYGMNFEIMPELHWDFGYPLAITLMIISAILPYALLKQRRLL